MIDLKDTVNLMNSSDYKDRFKAEYQQLFIRVAKLKTMLDKYMKNELDFTPTCSYDLLHTQLIHMQDYLNTLETRAIKEGIDINWLEQGL